MVMTGCRAHSAGFMTLYRYRTPPVTGSELFPLV